jgi:EamA domain-containing membrane protein RarD
MKTLLRIISFAGLGLMFTAAIMVFNDAMSKDTYLVLALVGTGMWFATVPFWMKRRLHHSE